MLYRYKVEYIDSECDDPKFPSGTEIESDSPVSIADAKELLLEQLEANSIYVDWLDVIDLQPIEL